MSFIQLQLQRNEKLQLHNQVQSQIELLTNGSCIAKVFVLQGSTTCDAFSRCKLEYKYLVWHRTVPDI